MAVVRRADNCSEDQFYDAVCIQKRRVWQPFSLS